MNIYEKLLAVRKAVPYLQKVNQGAQYKYVGSSDVLGAVRKEMDEHGLMVIPRVLKANVTTNENENARGGKVVRYFTEVWLEYTVVNAEKPDEMITIPWYAQGMDTEGEKGVGKALTYGEKYLFLKLLNIATDTDDPDAFQEQVAGGTVSKPQEERKREPDDEPETVDRPAGASKVNLNGFWASAKNLGCNEEMVHKEAAAYFGVPGLKSLNDVPGLDSAKLGKFLLHLRELVQQK